MRRITGMSGPVFDRDGDLFFGMEGDMWQGKLVRDDDGDYHGLNLEGHRCAPLATLETQNTSPDEMGVHRIAPATGWVYAHIYRMGGSGWGTIVRLKVEKSSNSGEDLAERLKVYGDAIRSVEILADNNHSSFLCASHDGSHVFYTEGGDLDTATLAENNGKP